MLVSSQYRKHVWMHENVQKRNRTAAAPAMAEGDFSAGGSSGETCMENHTGSRCGSWNRWQFSPPPPHQTWSLQNNIKPATQIDTGTPSGRSGALRLLPIKAPTSNSSRPQLYKFPNRRLNYIAFKIQLSYFTNYYINVAYWSVL